MSRVEFKVVYGSASRSFHAPEEKLGSPLIAPRKTKSLEGTMADILRQCLASPVGRPRLRELVEKRRVGIVISDEFRAGLQKQILEALLEEVLAGEPMTLCVLCATGTHDPKVYAKNAAQWVEELRKKHNREIEFVANESSSQDFVDIGATSRGTPVRVNRYLLECDIRVYGHESKHHYFHGYSCIDKQLLPGLSSDETIRRNHWWALDEGSGPGRSPYLPQELGRNNPVSEDTREARRLSELFVLSPSGKAVRGEVTSFGLDMISEGQQIYWVRCGDPEQISAEMVKVVDDMMAYRVKPARYVIVSPGGPPASQALYGTQNAFDLALKGAVQPGGEALVVAPLDGRPDLEPEVRGLAPSRRAKELFWDNLVRLRQVPLKQARQEIAEKFQLYWWKIDRVLKLLNGDRVRIYLHSELDPEKVEAGGFLPAPDIQAWIDERVARGDGQFTVIDKGNKLCVLPES